MTNHNGTGLYLELMKNVLTNTIYEDEPIPTDWAGSTGYHRHSRVLGLDWPSKAHTMVGLRRLGNVQDCLERVIADDVPGDLLEAGVWRGGVCIFMRALLKAHGIADRRVWVADSFQGMPEVSEASHPDDRELELHRHNAHIAVDLDTVKANFTRYGLLDDQVRFVPGWFADTLPALPVDTLAVLRLDADLYTSTKVALASLYPRVAVGGYVIIDDYLIDVCRAAVHEYRDEHGIDDPIQDIDGLGVFWRRRG